MNKAIIALEREYGGLPETLSAERLFTPDFLVHLASTGVGRGAAVYFWRGKGWAITAFASGRGTATKLAQQAAKKLKGKRSLTSSDPYLHDLPGFVMYSHEGEWALVAVSQATPKAPVGPSVTDARYALTHHAKQVFGASGVHLSGGAGAYHLEIRPALSKFRACLSG
ncbi:MAG: hypothetical protein ACHREM_20555 [Polyangiales bacterium]